MDRKEALNLSTKINQILNDWDFLNVARDVKNEYYCMVGPLNSLVVQNASEKEIEEYLRKELNVHFGVNIPEFSELTTDVVKKIHALSDPHAST